MKSARTWFRVLVSPVTAAVVLTAALVASVEADQGAEIRWVRAPGAGLHSQPRGTAAIRSRLPIGTELTVVSETGPWVEVTCKRGRGWVFAGRIGDRDPALEEDSFFQELAGDGEVKSREADTATAIRGLSKTAEANAARSEVAPEHVAAVKKLETWKIPDKEMRRFLYRGSLAEFQK